MWNTYIAGEFGGMNEVMARLYRITGEENYLKTARLFDNIDMFYGNAAHTHGLAKNVDTFRGLHANRIFLKLWAVWSYTGCPMSPNIIKLRTTFGIRLPTIICIVSVVWLVRKSRQCRMFY
jgi:hypothetical protein